MRLTFFLLLQRIFFRNIWFELMNLRTIICIFIMSFLALVCNKFTSLPHPREILLSWGSWMFHINILSLINPGHFCKKSVCVMFWDICEEKYGKMKCFSVRLPSFSRPLSPLFSWWILIVCAHSSRLQLRLGVGTESVRPSLSKML